VRTDSRKALWVGEIYAIQPQPPPRSGGPVDRLNESGRNSRTPVTLRKTSLHHCVTSVFVLKLSRQLLHNLSEAAEGSRGRTKTVATAPILKDYFVRVVGFYVFDLAKLVCDEVDQEIALGSIPSHIRVPDGMDVVQDFNLVM
jgi:hypothetical protein